MHVAQDEALLGVAQEIEQVAPDGDVVGALGLGPADAEPVVAGRDLALLLVLAHRREPLARAPAQVRVAVREQPVDVRPVGVEPLALAVRRVRPALVRALVPVEPEPAQRVVDLLLAVGLEARAVGVLDP